MKKRINRKNLNIGFGIVFGILFLAIAGVLYWLNPTFRSNINIILSLPNDAPVEVVEDATMEVSLLSPVQLDLVYNPDFDGGSEFPPVEKLAFVLKERVHPSLEVNKIDYRSEEGQKLIEEMQIKTLPAFIFDQSVESLPNFEEVENYSIKRNGKYLFRSKPFEYLEVPVYGDSNVRGADPEEAPIQIIFYCSFSTPKCDEASQLLKETIEKHPNQVMVAYKYFDVGSYDLKIANGAECAREQDQLFPFIDAFYEGQRQMSDESVDDILSRFQVKLGLDYEKFSECMGKMKYEQKVLSQTLEGYYFGVSEVPAMFVNFEYVEGLPTAEDLDNLVKAELERPEEVLNSQEVLDTQEILETQEVSS